MDIEFKKAIKRKENLDILRKEINYRWVSDKILNHLERNPYLEYSVEDIKEMILENDLVASKFIKEPGRQNMSENVIGDFIKNISCVENFINHPSNVNLFVVNGEITSERVDGIKSIDYTWTTNNKKIYATQKYTNEAGGAQDNQFNDVINFMSNAGNNKEYLFFAIVDGAYYTDEKIRILKKYQTDNVLVCKAVELEKILESI